MVKISDIFVFKKIEQKKKDAVPTHQPESDIPAVQPITPLAAVTAASGEKEMASASNSPSSEECQETYNEALSLIDEIMKEDALYELIDIHRISAIVEKLIALSRAHPDKMTELALNPDSCSQTTYIFCHVTNACVLAILVGLELEYDQYRLKELGTAALLHDVGMVHYLAIVRQKGKLNKEDFDKVKNHTLFAANVLSNIKGLDDVVFVVARQHHECLDGSGYPDGLKGDQIHEYSRIVGILDLYEAMMHRRTYRTEFQARETIQEILKNKNAYDPKLIKVLINKIGIFPIGSLVELNTKELARVVALNSNNVLRPVVKILAHCNGEECTEDKIVNLATEPAIWIKHIDKE